MRIMNGEIALILVLLIVCGCKANNKTSPVLEAQLNEHQLKRQKRLQLREMVTKLNPIEQKIYKDYGEMQHFRPSVFFDLSNSKRLEVDWIKDFYLSLTEESARDLLEVITQLNELNKVNTSDLSKLFATYRYPCHSNSTLYENATTNQKSRINTTCSLGQSLILYLARS